MKYQVLFPCDSIKNKFRKTLSKIPKKTLREKIMQELENLSSSFYASQRASTIKKLQQKVRISKYTAEYRLTIGDYRVLYDIEHKKRIVWILALRRRSEKTYK